MRNKFKKILFISAAAFIVITISAGGYILNLKDGISENILRLHIVGTSDSEYDQSLKICVRDRILSDFSDIFSDCENISDAKTAAASHKTEIEIAAADELRRHGCFETVTAEVENCRFPTKTYGSISLPGGNYTALNIKIGEAKGKNWWCVMYPPLCITDKTFIMSESSAAKLKECLTPEEYRLICQSDEGDIKIKFKIAEIIGKYIR